MDFWGFETREGMPGNRFGMLSAQQVPLYWRGAQGSQQFHVIPNSTSSASPNTPSGQVMVPVELDGRVTPSDPRAVQEAVVAAISAGQINVGQETDITVFWGERLAENGASNTIQMKFKKDPQTGRWAADGVPELLAEASPPTTPASATPAEGGGGNTTTNPPPPGTPPPGTPPPANPPPPPTPTLVTTGGGVSPFAALNQTSGEIWTTIANNATGARTVQGIMTAPPGSPFAYNYSAPGLSGSFATSPYGTFGSVGVGGPGGYGGYAEVGDFSGNNFYINQQNYENRAKARHLDFLTQILLAAICQGNVDMIESAITVINLKAKTTLIETAKHVIEAMRQYDKEMKTISDQMAALAGRRPEDGGASLQHLNAEMNSLSMVRTAITNMLRDIMTMNEEMSTLENSIYSKKDRDAQFYRWA